MSAMESASAQLEITDKVHTCFAKHNVKTTHQKTVPLVPRCIFLFLPLSTYTYSGICTICAVVPGALALTCTIRSGLHMKLQCLDLVAAFLLGASSAVCTRQPPTAPILARFRLPAWFSVHAWFLRLRTGFGFAQARLPAPDPVLHVSAPVRRGAVADARVGLA